MSQFTNVSPASSYGDILTTTNNGAGLSNVLQNVQDGLGNNSPVQIATNAINFNRTGGRTFQLDGVPLTVAAATLNNLAATSVSGTLNPAQVMAMNGASIELIPAQGANLLIMVNKFLVSLVYNTVSYTGGGNVYLQYSANGAASSDNYASDQVSAAQIKDGASNVGSFIGFIQSNLVDFLPTATPVNSPVCISNFFAPFATGDSDIKYYISYTVINLA